MYICSVFNLFAAPLGYLTNTVPTGGNVTKCNSQHEPSHSHLQACCHSENLNATRLARGHELRVALMLGVDHDLL